MTRGGCVDIWHSYIPSSSLMADSIFRRQLLGYSKSTLCRGSALYACLPTVSSSKWLSPCCRRTHDTCQITTNTAKWRKKKSIYCGHCDGWWNGWLENRTRYIRIDSLSCTPHTASVLSSSRQFPLLTCTMYARVCESSHAFVSIQKKIRSQNPHPYPHIQFTECIFFFFSSLLCGCPERHMSVIQIHNPGHWRKKIGISQRNHIVLLIEFRICTEAILSRKVYTIQWWRLWMGMIGLGSIGMVCTNKFTQ